MIRIQANTKIVNFKNQQMFRVEVDNSKTLFTVGIYVADLLLTTTLEEKDDPVKIYQMAKKLYALNEVEFEADFFDQTYKLVKLSKIDTLIKGQILEHFDECKKKDTKVVKVSKK